MDARMMLVVGHEAFTQNPSMHIDDGLAWFIGMNEPLRCAAIRIGFDVVSCNATCPRQAVSALSGTWQVSDAKTGSASASVATRAARYYKEL
jgi:hypothetical protein